jgi:ankyrin repeat protein
MLRHCLAPSLREQLNALPESLDTTYERVLNEIHSTKQGRHAHRLLQCLTVAMRPLRVEELAEVLAFELDTAEGELPRYHPNWRWEDQEHAVLSACSSLITIVNSDDSRVIQFSHFSVKEYLTSERLSTASGDVPRYHIALEPAHLILARACLGDLLSENTIKKEDDEGGTGGGKEGMALRKYAAEHWTSHAQVGNVSSYLRHAMETLFDSNKPYFGQWMRINGDYTYHRSKQTHLYFAALHGFYDLVHHLINRHPEQVTPDDTDCSPLVAALRSQKHVRIAELLVKHGARVHIRGDPPLFRVIRDSNDGGVNAVQFLLKHGAQVNAGDGGLMNPLHYAASVGCPSPEVARILLNHGADIALQDRSGQVPLHLVSGPGHKDEGDRLVLARLLLAGSCVDVNARDLKGETPLHRASYHGRPKMVQLLLAHGANAHAEDDKGRNPLHRMSVFPWEAEPQDALRVTELLLEQGVDVSVLDWYYETPLHIEASLGSLENTRLLLDCGAKADAQNVHGQIPLHLVSQRHLFSKENASVTRLLLQ